MKKRYLIGIPVLYNACVTKTAIDSVIDKENVDVLIIDNGADQDVKDLIYSYGHKISIISNYENVYVNPAWNQILNYFLNNEKYDYVCIMNSDIIMQPQFNIVMNEHHEVFPDDILIPKCIDDKTKINEPVDLLIGTVEKVHSGTAGINIILNRKQAKIVFPLPSWILVWFGDQIIYEVLREIGYDTFVLDILICYHYGSQNVKRLPGVSEIIEEDKRQWALHGPEHKQKLIEKFKFR
jgi:GT2 family glycosyltransferase